MHNYLLKRLFSTIPTLFLVTIVVFLLLHLSPGDPASMMLGSYATPAEIEIFREKMGFNRPLPEQYFAWLWRAVQGDLGQSLNANVPVLDMMIERLPRTFSLALLAMMFSVVIGMPLGILASIRQNTAYDQAAMSFALLGLSIPDFVAGLLLILLFSVYMGWAPSMGYVPIVDSPVEWFMHLLLPAFSLGFLMAAVTARMTRSSVVDVLRQDYVMTARSKGLPESKIIRIHVLKNALIPVVTVVGINFGAVFRGAVVIETLFAIPGLGRMLITGIQYRDYPVIQGCLLAIVTIYILINFLVDMLYAVLDPRIRYE